MRNYPVPESADRLPGLDLVRMKPRDYIEWKTLRRWTRLPEGEQNNPGYLLRMLREKAGLSQSQLAGKLGITQQAVAQAERWTSNSSLNFMTRWARACGRRLRIEVE